MNTPRQKLLPTLSCAHIVTSAFNLPPAPCCSSYLATTAMLHSVNLITVYTLKAFSEHLCLVELGFRVFLHFANTLQYSKPPTYEQVSLWGNACKLDS